MAGWRAWNAAIRDGTSRRGIGGIAPTATRPARSPRNACSSSTTLAASASTRRAPASSTSPGSVSATWRLVRRSKSTPSSRSSRRTCWETAGCATMSSLLARVKLR